MPAAESKKGHAVDDDLALVGRLHAGDAAQRTALAATRGTEQRHTTSPASTLHVEHKPGIALFDIQNERHGLSTSLQSGIIAHELGQRLAIDTQGIAARRVERIALSGKIFGLFALRTGKAPLAILLRMSGVHIDEQNDQETEHDHDGDPKEATDVLPPIHSK